MFFQYLGAENYEEYKYLLKDKKIGLVVNHTSFVKNKHLLDYLIEKGSVVGYMLRESII